MLKRVKIIVLIFSVVLISCEKDDISNNVNNSANNIAPEDININSFADKNYRIKQVREDWFGSKSKMDFEYDNENLESIYTYYFENNNWDLYSKRLFTYQGDFITEIALIQNQDSWDTSYTVKMKIVDGKLIERIEYSYSDGVLTSEFKRTYEYNNDKLMAYYYGANQTQPTIKYYYDDSGRITQVLFFDDVERSQSRSYTYRDGIVYEGQSTSSLLSGPSGETMYLDKYEEWTKDENGNKYMDFDDVTYLELNEDLSIGSIKNSDFTVDYTYEKGRGNELFIYTKPQDLVYPVSLPCWGWAI